MEDKTNPGSCNGKTKTKFGYLPCELCIFVYVTVNGDLDIAVCRTWRSLISARCYLFLILSIGTCPVF